MNRFFSHNLPWKIASLFLATMLWIFVINTQNPIFPKEIKGQTLNIRGINELEAKGFVLQNEEELRNLQVRVVVKGPRLEMEKLLTDEGSFDVRIDLTSYATSLTSEDAESIEKPVTVVAYTSLKGIEIEEIRPQTVSVIFEKEKIDTIEIEHNISGATNSEYMTLDPVLNPRTVDISGPKSAVESVERAVVDINVDNFSQDVLSYTVPIRLLNQDGNEVTGVRMSPESIQVTLPIGKKKTVPITPQFKGELPPGYLRTNTMITPENVTIVGDPSVVDQITDIKLEYISLDNMIQSGSFNVNLLLPDQITPIDQLEGKAVVSIEIQKESFYEYIIQTKDLILQVNGLPDDCDLVMDDTEITLVLSGTAENLLSVTGKNIEATIDLATLGEISSGNYSVPVAFEIPENLKILTSPATLQITIHQEEEEVEETFEPEEEVEELEIPEV